MKLTLFSWIGCPTFVGQFIADKGLLFWWAHQDLNLGPKDSGLCSFHYSLDYAFIISIARLRWVPSSLYTFNSTFILKLGSALAWIFLNLLPINYKVFKNFGSVANFFNITKFIRLMRHLWLTGPKNYRGWVANRRLKR